MAQFVTINGEVIEGILTEFESPEDAKKQFPTPDSSEETNSPE